VTTTVGQFDADGWLAGVVHVASPNADERLGDFNVDLIVVHAISLPPGEYGSGDPLRFFTNTLDCSAHPFYEALRELRVSAHFLIERDGTTTQFVSTDRRAWHAGVSVYAGRPRCNDFSVGIELEGCDTDAFTPVQYAQLGWLVDALQRRYPAVTSERIAGHSDIAPGRKTDPGPLFDWAQVRART